MWGIASVCALLLCAVVASDLLSGRFALTLSFLGSDSTFQITRAVNPILFWVAAGIFSTIAILAVTLASRGLSRVQRDERKNA